MHTGNNMQLRFMKYPSGDVSLIYQIGPDKKALPDPFTHSRAFFHQHPSIGIQPSNTRLQFIDAHLSSVYFFQAHTAFRIDPIGFLVIPPFNCTDRGQDHIRIDVPVDLIAVLQ